MINNRTEIDVKMELSAQLLDNVVVTGFQNIPKANFTGSAVKVKGEDLRVKGVSDLSRMLEGQVAGVSIQNVSGIFGAAPKVRVREATSISGENKPLWVIDGVVHEDIINISNDQLTSGDPSTLLGSAVAGLNANDIESIDILKDASATALYGARAMNGVILVTTKRGKEGRPIVTYSGNYSLQLKPSYSNYDIMNSANQVSIYAELERKGFLNTDIINRSNSGIYGKMYTQINTYDEESGSFLLENLVAARRSFLERYAYANTNWFDILFRNSTIQEHSVLSQLYIIRWKDSNNGATDCVVLRLDESTGDMPLSTLADVYKQVYLDLDDAIALYTSFGLKRKDNYYPDINVAYAVYARAALTRQDYPKAATMAVNARNGYPLMSNTAYKAGFYTPTSEWIWSSYGASDETLYFYSYFAYMAYNSSASAVRTYPKCISRELFNTIPSSDIRKGLFLDPTGYTYTTSSGEAGSALKAPGFQLFPDLYRTAKVFAYMQFKIAAEDLPGVGNLNHFRSSDK